MTNPPEPVPSTPLEEATRWFTRLRDDSVTDEAISEWIAWLEARPNNASAFRKVQDLWALAGDAGITDWPKEEAIRADSYEADEPVSEWRKRGCLQAVARMMDNDPTPRTTRRPRFAVGLAASVVILVGSALLVSHLAPEKGAQEYATDRGIQRQISMTDGSVIALGGASAIRVNYLSAKRDLTLEHGEAYFKVARDKTRPFIVRSGDLRVTAIGTAFTVRADGGRTQVTVTEGVVEVDTDGATGSGSSISMNSGVTASAGQQIAYDGEHHLTLSRTASTAIALGWQDGALTFVDEPLAAVVARLNRYSPQRVILGDSSLAEMHFTGTIFQNRLDEWTRGIEHVFPVHVIHQSDGSLILEPRQ